MLSVLLKRLCAFLWVLEGQCGASSACTASAGLLCKLSSVQVELCALFVDMERADCMDPGGGSGCLALVLPDEPEERAEEKCCGVSERALRRYIAVVTVVARMESFFLS
jgi:hypothetical protein